VYYYSFFFSSRRRHTRFSRDWSSDVCSSDLENEKYEMEAESNRVNLVLIPPRRGWILDRNGSPLASNRADFRVDIIPERLDDPRSEERRVGKEGRSRGSPERERRKPSSSG